MVFQRAKYAITSTTKCDKKWVTPITIEPAYALFWFLENSSTFLYNNLILQKACRYNQTEEPDVNSPCDSERDGVSFVAFVNSWIRMIELSLTIFFTIFASSWSDRAGKIRRPFIMLPLGGLSVEIFLGCVNSYFWTIGPLSAALQESFIHVVCGGRALLFLIGNMYMSDITNLNNRTQRIGILVILRFLMTPISNATTGIMLNSLGFLYSFVILLFISILAIISAVLLMRDYSEPVDKKISYFDLFNPINTVESIRIVFRKRPQRKRTILIVLLITNFLTAFAKEGEYSILYLYVRYRFHWNEREYGIYAAYQNIGMIVGLLFCLFFLSSYLKIHDGLIGTFAGFWDTIAALCYVFATQTWQLYSIPLIDIFHGAAYIIAKAFLTKIVDNNEQGHLTSVIALSLLFLPINHTIYNSVFNYTMDVFPSCFFYVSVIVDIPICILYWYSYSLCRRYNDKHSSDEKESN